MFYFLYQNSKMNLDELYLHDSSPNNPDDFHTWVLSNLQQNIIQYENTNRISEKAYIKQQIATRKQKLHEQVMHSYMSAFHENRKKRRKAIKEAYKKSEQYTLDFGEVCRKDDILKQLSCETSCHKLYTQYLQEKKSDEFEKIEKILAVFCNKKREEFLIDFFEKNSFFTYKDTLSAIIKEKFIRCLRTDDCIYNPEIFVESFNIDPEYAVSSLIYGEDSLFIPLTNYFFQEIPALACLKNQEAWQDVFCDSFDHDLSDFSTTILMDMNITVIEVVENLMQNPVYKEDVQAFYEKKKKEGNLDYFTYEELEIIKQREEEKKQRIEKSMVSTIPKEYKNLFPLARQLKRNFILHIGPTNSGKTSQAMKALQESGSGIYLAPLRLLTFEQYERLNAQGFLCNLITGEEKMMTPSATFQASTIEMADFKTFYPVAVIDEAQMLSDPHRGGAWTAAILGLCAGEIHICAAPHAKDILIRLIQECGDNYELVEHWRETPLVVEDKSFHFPKDVEPQDALIVFSRKNAHAIAADLQKEGRKCSIIYGNLPYDVRQEEAKKFINGENEVLVSTDAIGMGMNLPIRRVIFLETEKYDGNSQRPLKPDEIQQIAGRAGRRGIYDIGLINSLNKNAFISHSLQEMLPPIQTAILRFPESLLGIDAPLSDILKRWNGMQANEGYQKENIYQQIALCKKLEQVSNNKRLIYDFITIPFDTNNELLKHIWFTLFKYEKEKKELDYRHFLSRIEDNRNENLQNLEEQYKILDLLWYYLEKFHGTEEHQSISEKKKQISGQIIKILSKQKLKGKRCRICGAQMPWNYRYGMCKYCYQESAFADPWYPY